MSVDIDFAADLPSEETAAPDLMKRLVVLAEEVKKLETDAALQMVKLAETQAKIDKRTQTLIPDIMKSLSMTEFKMEDGTKITIKSSIQCSIPKDLKDKAYQWLKDHGHGGLIKTNLSASFGREDGELVEKVLAALKSFEESEGVEIGAVAEESIHTQTLTAFVREHMAQVANKEPDVKKEDGFDNDDSNTLAALPPELFSVFEREEAKIALPKPKKPAKVKA